MSVTRDIPRAWLRPRAVMAERLAHNPSERVAFVYLAAGSVLGFVAQLPALVRRAQTPDPTFEAALVSESARVGVDIPADLADAKFEALVSGAVMGWIFIVPIALYILAFVSHLIARIAGGRGTGLDARVALFWAFLAVAPALLLLGLTTGFVGPGAAQSLVGFVTLGGFVWVWLNSLYVAETL
ncbi:YIP1 family protein [uncultured Jannaschia sp.]|uniref:YIP1 family protein n=1 Tax=uncultured Jannaschia sp. TaxID=293347 RepID=UPI00262A1374|nr:YIP1 family protein [uncultured Jannaschia sp.]